MHLTEMLALRSSVASAVYFAITRRCPLSCAHCSTNSTSKSEQFSEDIFIRFASTFTQVSRPELVIITGGEPLLRPALVERVADISHEVGSRVVVGSGLFFATLPSVPMSIDRALDAVDHFMVSMDIFHDAEVPRANAISIMKRYLDRGKQMSVQLTRASAHDEYVDATIHEIRHALSDRVPILVGDVSPVGRASQWLDQTASCDASPAIEPCVLAHWPVVAFDGTIVACTNQIVVDGPAPAHLSLGHASRSTWTEIHERVQRDLTLNAIRLFGPQSLQKRIDDAASCSGYCSTCHRLSSHTDLAARVEKIAGRQSIEVLSSYSSYRRRDDYKSHVPEAYAHLLHLGK